MTNTEKRLLVLERANMQRLQVWAESLTLDELDAEIETRRRANPDAWAEIDAMTLDEITAELTHRGVRV
jgi:hypothetical protein